LGLVIECVMETSRSPRKVLRSAWRLARRVLPEYSSPHSRRDFTSAQLFACLSVRTFYGLSYRRTEQLLRDSPEWLEDIDLEAVPDHNTLWRAVSVLMTSQRVDQMLDLIVRRSKRLRLLTLNSKPLAVDSTCFELHHRSAYYERRCQAMNKKRSNSGAADHPANPGRWGASVNDSRRQMVIQTPKLALAVASACHLIVAANARIGVGSDSPDFSTLLHRSCRRAPVKTVVADAGYDSEANHFIAREQLNVRSIIPPGIGRPSKKLPTGRWRRLMAKRFKRKADKAHYAQRTQCETVHSMIKRNQGSALRARTPERRKQEMMMRVLVHNIALLAELEEAD
jgi:hypothetical protein